MKCAFCEVNEATHFNTDWDAMLCDPCADAQDASLEDIKATRAWLKELENSGDS